MALKFFENSIDSGTLTDPDSFYKGQQQAFQDAQWDNTSARDKILEQDGFGLDSYHEEEVWINEVVGTTTTFMKNGQDYMQILFKDIDRHCERGLMYLYDDNYWLADFYNPPEGLGTDITLRRCNNSLRMIDPDNGALFEIPCVIDYDMTSPSIQVSSYVITPNNHATVIVQANEATLRLFKYNTRFMLRGRPFKLYSFQDALNRGLSEPNPPVLYLDLYLDELHANDDIENQLADNGEYDYSIDLATDSLELLPYAVGTLNAKVLLNGNEVARDIIWKSSNNNVLTTRGNVYEVSGEVRAGTKVKISGHLKGNKDINVEIDAVVVEQHGDELELGIEPMFEKIRQHESISIIVRPYINGESTYAQSYIVETEGGISVEGSDDKWTITGQKIDRDCWIHILARNVRDTGRFVRKSFHVRCVSMMG